MAPPWSTGSPCLHGWGWLEDNAGSIHPRNSFQCEWYVAYVCVINRSFKYCSVKPEEVEQLPTWQREENIPTSIVKLSDVLEFDEDGELTVSDRAARKALITFLTATWGISFNLFC